MLASSVQSVSMSSAVFCPSDLVEQRTLSIGIVLDAFDVVLSLCLL